MTHVRHRPLRLLAGFLLLIGFIAMSWPRFEVFWYERSRPRTLPTSQSADAYLAKPRVATIETTTTTPPADVAPELTEVPSELNLAVPFTSQAPFANWDPDHEEYCEEASLLMVARFFAGQSITEPDDAETALASLKDWQIAHFGFFTSTTAEETKQMAEANFDLTLTLSTDVNTESIQRTLAAGQLIILPAAGRELGNPYFQRPGPVYHMLVVKGYTADGQFITNDPGTRRGADFVYPADRLLAAVGDYNHGDPTSGARVMLVAQPAQD